MGLLGSTTRDEPLEVDLQLGAFTLSGRIDALYNGRLAFFRPGTMKPKDRIRAWIQHLVYCGVKQESRLLPGSERLSLLVAEDDAIQFDPLSPDESRAHLETLLSIYWSGLQRPIPFFPISSLEFISPTKSKTEPIERARAKWRGGRYLEPEMNDPAYRLCFGERDPLDAEFEQLALAVCGPIQARKISASP